MLSESSTEFSDERITRLPVKSNELTRRTVNLGDIHAISDHQDLSGPGKANPFSTDRRLKPRGSDRLHPCAGAYSVVIQGATGGSGVALFEIYALND